VRHRAGASAMPTALAATLPALGFRALPALASRGALIRARECRVTRHRGAPRDPIHGAGRRAVRRRGSRGESPGGTECERQSQDGKTGALPPHHEILLEWHPAERRWARRAEA
jgi:hypothetical protein